MKFYSSTCILLKVRKSIVIFPSLFDILCHCFDYFSCIFRFFILKCLESKTHCSKKILDSIIPNILSWMRLTIAFKSPILNKIHLVAFKAPNICLQIYHYVPFTICMLPLNDFVFRAELSWTWKIHWKLEILKLPIFTHYVLIIK